jgi:hypothetical protein
VLHIGELKSDSDMCAFLRLGPSTGIGSLQSRAAVLESGDRRKIGGICLSFSLRTQIK